MTKRLIRALVAVLIGTAAGVAGLATPAHAAACPAGTGVTVVVGSSVGCDRDGGGSAASNFSDAGHALKYASRSPGFVCRVDGAPATDPCVEASPSDAYWGLFWSDGKSGSWVYSSLGVMSLKVPAGGSVAFVFQNSERRTLPAVAPPVAPKEPAARPSPSEDGAAKDRPRRTDGGSGAKDAPVVGSEPRATATPGSIATPSAAPTSAAPTSAPPTTDPTTSPSPRATTTTAAVGDEVAAEDGDGSVRPLPADADAAGTSAPAVAAGLAVVAVLTAAAGIVWRRRRGV